MQCSPHVEATCPLTLLRRVLAERGEITIRQSDLDGLLGLTEFSSATVHLDHQQSDGEWRATLAHELIHLLRGPVPNAHAAAEEIEVRRETAQHLVPIGPALRMIDRSWCPDELQEIAARAGVDHGTVQDAVDPPTVPTPVTKDDTA